MSDTADDISDADVDSALSLSIMFYDPNDKWPEWSNAMMRTAYRAGWDDGYSAGVDIERDEQAATRDALAAEVERLRARATKLRELCRSPYDVLEVEQVEGEWTSVDVVTSADILAVLDGEGGSTNA